MVSPGACAPNIPAATNCSLQPNLGSNAILSLRAAVSGSPVSIAQTFLTNRRSVQPQSISGLDSQNTKAEHERKNPTPFGQAVFLFLYGLTTELVCDGDGKYTRLPLSRSRSARQNLVSSTHAGCCRREPRAAPDHNKSATQRNSPVAGDGNWGVSVYISVLSGETARWTVIPSPLNYNVEAGARSRYG